MYIRPVYQIFKLSVLVKTGFLHLTHKKEFYFGNRKEAEEYLQSHYHGVESCIEDKCAVKDLHDQWRILKDFTKFSYINDDFHFDEKIRAELNNYPEHDVFVIGVKAFMPRILVHGTTKEFHGVQFYKNAVNFIWYERGKASMNTVKFELTPIKLTDIDNQCEDKRRPGL